MQAVCALFLYTGCYSNFDLKSCRSYGVTRVRIGIFPFGPSREHVIDETYPQICHPMKCVNGRHSGRDVSITVKAISGGNDGIKFTTQPTQFHQGDQFYTSISACYNGHSNVVVNCRAAAGFYGLSKNNIACAVNTVISDTQSNGLYLYN